MKKTILYLFILVPMVLFSQETIFDKVAKETCEFMNSESVIGLKGKELSNKLGVFIVQRYNEYKEEFVAVNFDLDFTKGGDEAIRLGEKIGLTMINHCPDILVAFSESVNEENKTTIPEKHLITGEILDIEESEFSYLTVKDVEGKRQKLYWMQNFEGSFELTNKKTWKGKKVSIEFRNFECYSAPLEEYIVKKEIISIEYI